MEVPAFGQATVNVPAETCPQTTSPAPQRPASVSWALRSGMQRAVLDETLGASFVFATVTDTEQLNVESPLATTNMVYCACGCVIGAREMNILISHAL